MSLEAVSTFGMAKGTGSSWRRSASCFAVTRERIRQIETKALRKLRHPLRSQRLRVFADAL